MNAEFFNVKVLDEWLRHKPKLITKFIDLTLDGAESISSDLKDAHTHLDFVEINRYSHSLKSIAAQIGGMALSSICLSIEKASADKDIKKIEECLLSFDASYAEFMREIESFRKIHNV